MSILSGQSLKSCSKLPGVRYAATILFFMWLAGMELHGKSIIYQPQHDDFGVMVLEKRFKFLQKMEFKELIIQWTSYGEYNFFEKHPYWIAELLDLAQRYDIEIIFGLHSDPLYFKHIKKEKDLQDYLSKLAQKHIKIAIDLAVLVGDSPAFKGWYIPDEINDHDWDTKSRKSDLGEYLRSLDQALTALTPRKKIMISSYFASRMHRSAYIKMLMNIIPSDWCLLLQSGVGAKLVSLDRSKEYYNLFINRYQGNWKFIIELFSINGKILEPDFILYKKQAEYIDNKKRVLFSWRYFFDKEFQLKYLNFRT